MSQLHIERDEEEGWQILRFTGNVDAATLPLFEQALLQVGLQHPAKVIFDFEHLNHINSRGLGLLLATMRQLRHHGGQVKIVNINDHLRAIMDLLGLSRLLDEDEDSPDSTQNGSRRS